jgi:hypothetical protein
VHDERVGQYREELVEDQEGKQVARVRQAERPAEAEHEEGVVAPEPVPVGHVPRRVHECEQPEDGDGGGEERSERVDPQVQPDGRRDPQQVGLVDLAVEYAGDEPEGERSGHSAHHTQSDGAHPLRDRPSQTPASAPASGRNTASGGISDVTYVLSMPVTPHKPKTKCTAASASENGMPGTWAVVPRMITYAAQMRIGTRSVGGASSTRISVPGGALKNAR